MQGTEVKIILGGLVSIDCTGCLRSLISHYIVSININMI
jgi:hypothetical protein